MRSHRFLATVTLAAAAIAAGACSSAEDAVLDPTTTDVDVSTPDTSPTTVALEPADAELISAIEADIAAQAAGCEVLDPRSCLLPFPSDHFTEPVEPIERDDGLGPGNPLQVALDPEHLPQNSDGVAFDPTEWNRNDGWSPGAPLIIFAPGVDVEASGLPQITDIGSSVDPESPIVVVDVDSGVQVPVWAELDDNANDDADRLLYIRPAINFVEGHRHVVGIRGLVDADGEPLESSAAFIAHRDRLSTEIPEVEDERERMERVFADLETSGVERSSLYLAWDFTVASTRSLAERMLHIRDDSFEDLGEDVPSFEVTSVDDPPVDFEVTRVARWVEGTFEVPLYLAEDGAPGTRFNTADNGLPEANGTITANFVCSVPNSVVRDRIAGRPVVYGHGLLGSRYEMRDNDHIAVAGDTNDFVYCATDWLGMAEEDIANAASILQQLDRFPTLADRVQQGMLNTLFLARLMIHPDGLVSHDAFQVGGDPLLDISEAYYDGNSQGAIIGGAVTAFAQDWTGAVLGVGGMNYSTLLQRSTDFDVYAAILEPAYPDVVDRAMGIAVIQMLWDRAETNGYAQHLTDDALPRTPDHRILMQVAVGDFQVANVTAEVMARTIGAAASPNSFESGRNRDVEPLVIIEKIAEYPYDGSALVYWDTGTPLAPLGNTPPRHPSNVPDPHEDPRRQPAAMEQKNAFLRPDGVVVDVCDGGPCTGLPRGELDLNP